MRSKVNKHYFIEENPITEKYDVSLKGFDGYVAVGFLTIDEAEDWIGADR